MIEEPKDSGPPPTPDWIVTFTDLMSLLLTFFILLLTFSTPKIERLFEVRGSLAGSFGIIAGERDDYDSESPPLPIRQGRDMRNPFSPSTPPRFQPLEDHDPNLNLQKLRDDSGEEIEFEKIGEGYKITIGDALFFDPGAVQLTGRSLARLGKIATALKHYHYHLVVVGHVGGGELQQVLASGEDPMELAIRRAVWVADRLAAQHAIDPAILAVAGYGPRPEDTGPGLVELILADRARVGAL